MAQWRECLPPTNVARVRLLPGITRGLRLGASHVFTPENLANISTFQFDQDRGPAGKSARADAASSLNIIVYCYLFIICLYQLFNQKLLT